MKLCSLEHTKIRFRLFVCDTIFDFGTNNHLCAMHEIVHDTFKHRDESLFIFEDKNVNLIICGDLESLIASHEENVASHVFNFMDLLPSLYYLDAFSLFSLFLNFNLLEYQEIARGSNKQNLIVCKIHITKIKIGHDFHSRFFITLHCICNDLTLSVESVAFFHLWIVERATWKIDLCRMYYVAILFLRCFTRGYIVEETVLSPM